MPGSMHWYMDIWGRTSRAVLRQLADLADATDLDIEQDGGDRFDPETFQSGGLMLRLGGAPADITDDIQPDIQALGLSYRAFLHCDEDISVTLWTPGMDEPIFCVATVDGDPAVSLDELARHFAAGKTLAEVIDLLLRFETPDDTTLTWDGTEGDV